jgi:hypothetical protein
MTHIDAFASGLFDGEGTVGIRKQERRSRYTYSLNVQFHMTNKEVLEFLRIHYGGNPIHTCKRYPRKRQGYRYNLFGDTAINFLKAICPYSIVKREEIILSLEFASFWKREHNPKGGFRNKTQDELDRADRYFCLVRDLKKP